MRTLALITAWLLLVDGPTLVAQDQAKKAAPKKSAPAKKKKSTARRPASTAQKAAPPAKKSAAPAKPAAKKSASTKGKSATRKKAARRPARSTQQEPAPERYQQIQRALIAKGYLTGEPTGKWGTDSSDALKKFQQDQNLNPTGKLDSLSLIALGLGPKRTATQKAQP